MDPLASAARRLDEAQAELVEARQQQAATSEILRLLSQARADPQPVFDTIARAGMQVCRAVSANVFTFDGSLMHLVATTRTGEHELLLRKFFPCAPSRASGAGRAILARDVVRIPDIASDPEYLLEGPARMGGFLGVLAVPLLLDGRPIGVIAVGRATPGVFPDRQVALLQTFAEQAVIAMENTRLFNELQKEVEAHRRSKAAIQVLVEDRRGGADAMVGDSPALCRVRDQVEKVAPTDSTVLLLGETGTGKELVARAIHRSSRRHDRPLITVNCAAMPRDLVESELFGHEKGAFTGAAHLRRGRFELADGGTLFLDEVGELPLEAQAKLLRVLQEGEYERVGGSGTLHTDVRVVAATNRDLAARIAAGQFRSDLFYRLNVFPIALPPLRERRADVEPLVRHFAKVIARRLGRPDVRVAPEFIERARAYEWPGNIRELENVIERALITSGDGNLDAVDLLPAPAPAQMAVAAMAAAGSLEELEKNHIRGVLERTSWKIEGPFGAAQILGMNPSTLRGRMRKLGIRK